MRFILFFSWAALLTLTCFVFSTSTAEGAGVGETCYQILQKELREIGIFKEAELHFSGVPYHQLKENSSPIYRNISSFGVDLDHPMFGLKTYTFGNPTGYIHPPEGPYPKSRKSDRWEEAAKQNIYAEEYIQDESGKEHFLGCAYFRIDAPKLMEVTRDRYLYDGDLMSAKKTGTGYKAWYTENNSFDLDNNPFVTWKRLFIYPADTQNGYFDRFSIFDAVPGNPVPSLSDLFSVNDQGDGVNYVVYGSLGEILSTSNPNLAPVRWEENNIFPFNAYYQAIESAFPDIAPRLSIHGAVSYNTFKRLLAYDDETKRNSVWSVVADTRDVTKYYIQKQKGEISEESEVFESFLAQIPRLEEKIESIVEPHEQKEKAEALKQELEKEKQRNKPSDENIQDMTEETWYEGAESLQIPVWRYIVAGGAVVFVLFSLILFIRRKHE